MFIYVYIYRLIKEIYKTYFGYCFPLTMARKKFKKTYRPKLPHQVQRNKSTKNRDIQTLPSISRPQ